MSKLISRKIVKPPNCALVFGIPITESEFVEAVDDNQRDFVYDNPKNRPWGKYQRDISSHWERMKPHLEAFGLNVFYGATSSHFEKLLGGDTFDVCILFSHKRENDGSVEFFDGMASIERTVALVPTTFGGIIDLSVCNPKRLAVKLIHEKECLTRRIGVSATPGPWLYFYWALFTFLQTQDLTYLEAMARAVGEFKKQGRMNNGFS